MIWISIVGDGRNSLMRKSCSTRSLSELRNQRQRRTPSFHSIGSGGSRDGDSGEWLDSQDREDFGSCHDIYDADVVALLFSSISVDIIRPIPFSPV